MRTSPLAVALGLGLFACAIASREPLNAWLDQGVAPHWPTVRRRKRAPSISATLWDAAWGAPWAGYGWQQVGVAQQLATLDHPASHEWITFSHSLALALMVWHGAVPGLLLSAAITWWAARRLARCRSVDSWALLAAGGVLVIHALVEFPLAYTYFLLPLGVMVGAIDALEGGPPSRALLPRCAFAAVLALLTAMLAWVWVEYVEIEDTAREMAFKEAGYVTKGPEPQVPQVRLLDNQREFLWFRSMRATPGMSEETLDRMKTLSQRFAPPRQCCGMH